MSRGRRLFSCLIGGALAASLAACGGGSSPSTPTPTPTPVPTPPPPRVVAQGSGVSVPVGWAMGEYFDIAATGTLEATVDYTFADTLMFVWIAKGQCTADAFEAEQCQYAATSFSGGKPRKVSASGQTAGTYTLIFGNLGPKDESVSYQVVFSQTTAGGAPAASARRSAEPGFLTRLPASARP